MEKYFLKKRVIILFSTIAMTVLIIGLFIFFDFNSGKSAVKKISRAIEGETAVLAQEIPLYFMPRFPQRLMYLSSEMARLSNDLYSLKLKLNELTIDNCDCRYAQSQCQQNKIFGLQLGCKPGPIGTFGDPCLYREEIEDRQFDIQMKIEQFSFLQKLLQKEMEAGLEKELKTLRPEVAEELEDNLEKLLQLNQDIIPLSQEAQNLPLECTTEGCQSQCKQGLSFKLMACLLPGQQKPMEAVFEAGVGLDDLELGKVGIKNINLGLPEKIGLKNLGELSSFAISLPAPYITFPEIPIADLQAGKALDLSGRSIVFHPPSPTIPQPPLVELSCPNLPGYQSYQCSSQIVESKYYIEAEWYFQNFSWLSEKCQELPGMKGGFGIPTEEIEKCFDPENVHLTIIEECDAFWLTYNPEFPETIPPICESLGQPCLGRAKAHERECQNLLGPVSDCNLEILCDTNKPIYCTIPLGCAEADGYITKENVEMIIETLEEECDQLKAEEIREMPEPCKFLPLFTKEFPTPEPFEYSGGTQDCPAQEIGDFPLSMLGCGASPPTLPKITFPKIIIPDIYLPHIKFLPFFEIKLPNFIFEDLVLPDLNLCDLDNCANIFPDLRFQLLHLTVPEIAIPSIQLPDLEAFIDGVGLIRVPLPEIKLGEIEYPQLSFNFLQLFNLGNLITPELELPEIKLPQPKLHFAFKGLNIDLLNLLLGLVSKAFSIPSGCIGIDFHLIPLRIIFPDFIFYWPAFPRIPEIPFCKEANQFCQELKNSLKEATDKVSEIENIVNKIFQTEIQAKLNQAAQIINQTLTASIQGQFNQYAQKIKAEIEKHIQQNARVVADVLKIPPMSIPLGDIIVPAISLSEITGLPNEISILWPEDLKKITLLKDIGYQLPTIPLSKISYKKEIPIKIPGFQMTVPTVNFSLLENYPTCTSQPPSGGNPCPTDKTQDNFEKINQINQEIDQTSQKIIDILE